LQFLSVLLTKFDAIVTKPVDLEADFPQIPGQDKDIFAVHIFFPVFVNMGREEILACEIL